MRLFPFLLAATVSATVSISAFAVDAPPAPLLRNFALTFADFWDANQDKPIVEQVAAFKASSAKVFPGFYNAERLKGFLTPAEYDEQIARSIKQFPAIRPGYMQKVRQFGAELPKYIGTFKTAIPDFQPPQEIYLLHSLGEMDGGLRTIDGKPALIFGADVMTMRHGKGNESAFFHHQLFRHYHLPRLEACAGAGNWYALWTEGLATYASKVLNPQASDQELLLDDLPARTQAVLPEALAQLESVLDSNDQDSYAGLFLLKGNGSTLPRRHGYYLGYLVAQEAGKTRDVRALANLACGPAKELVFSTVHQLRQRAH